MVLASSIYSCQTCVRKSTSSRIVATSKSCMVWVIWALTWAFCIKIHTCFLWIIRSVISSNRNSFWVRSQLKRQKKYHFRNKFLLSKSTTSTMLHFYWLKPIVWLRGFFSSIKKRLIKSCAMTFQTCIKLYLNHVSN